MNTLIGDLTETFKGTSMVPQMDNSTVASTTLNYDYPEIHEVDLVATEKVSEMTTLKDIIERTNMFPIKASNVFVDEDEEDQTIENLSVVKKTFHYPSIALSTIEVSLFEYAQDVLKKLLSTVNLYSQQDWIEAYNRIDFDIKTSKPDNAIRDICISNEIYEIAKNSSWDFVYDMGDSYIFNGIFWVKLEEKQVLHFMRDISIQMGIKKFEAIASKFGENIYKEVIYSGALSPTKKPTGKLLLNMMNGTLHVSNNELSLKPHDKKDFLKYQLQFNYNINAVNQEWLQFLEDVLPDKDTQKTLQQSLGSLFLRGVKLTKMVLLYGTGANGKSVIFDVINGLLGKELVSNYSLNSLTDPKGYHRAQIKDKLINFIVKNASGLLYIGKDNKDYYLSYGVDENKLFSMPYTVNNDFFQNLSNKEKENITREKEKLGLKKDLPIILYASKFIKRKNPVRLLESFASLSTNGKSPSAYLLYIGEGEEKQAIKNKIKEYGLEDNVKLLGFKNQSELPLYFTMCDVFVLPSNKEPYGLIVNEVLNCAKPIITTTEVGSAKDLIVHNENGFIYEPEDIESLSKYLKKFIDDDTLSETMGQKSLEKINTWSYKENVEGIYKALKSLNK